MRRFVLSVVLVSISVGLVFSASVEEVAPGVFFRVEDKGCNNGWIVFEDYVLVIDANFPNVVKEVIGDIRKTTDKPIRFVLDTHHHGDHALGNCVFSEHGATIIAQRDCADILRSPELIQSFENWTRGKPEYRDVSPCSPTLTFNDRLVFDDGNRRVEIVHTGHAHTAGDTVAYLPGEKILFTGDFCVNGAFNYLGEAYTENWIERLTDIQGWDVKTVCPGHGDTAGKELLETQKQCFIQLREQVEECVKQGKSLDETIKTIDIPMYKEWTGVDPRDRNIEHVYREATGLITPWEIAKLDLHAGPSPTKDSPGWSPPKKILVQNMNKERLANLRLLAPNVEFVSVSNDRDVAAHIENADAINRAIRPEHLRKTKNLRWVHSRTAGVERYLFDEFIESDVVLTNAQGMYGPAMAEHVLGMILMFTKALAKQHERKLEARWGQDRSQPVNDLAGRTMLILGLGGIGKQVAQRAAGFEMVILAIDPQDIEKPDHVRAIYPPSELDRLLPQADVVVSTVPHTEHTHRYFGKKQFDLMKPTAYFINVGRGKTVVQEELIEALKHGSIAGAGLDVTDPEPLPADHPLWKLDNVVITPHMSGRTAESFHRGWLLFRENVRRFVAGEPLLNVVNKKAGY